MDRGSGNLPSRRSLREAERRREAADRDPDPFEELYRAGHSTAEAVRHPDPDHPGEPEPLAGPPVVRQDYPSRRSLRTEQARRSRSRGTGPDRPLTPHPGRAVPAPLPVPTLVPIPQPNGPSAPTVDPFPALFPVPVPTGGDHRRPSSHTGDRSPGYRARDRRPQARPEPVARPASPAPFWARFREPRSGRTRLGSATRWELLGLGSVVAGVVALVVVLVSHGWLARTPEQTFLSSADAAAAAPTSAAASPETAVGVRSWLSGAGGPQGIGANGTWARWRGEPVTIGGTWDNGNAEMVEMHSICPGGAWARWTAALDIAVGAIDVRAGETWAKAAQGAYDTRWRTHLRKVASCWGTRDPALLYLRFAHEMNLTDMPWQVRGGEEAAFVAALTRYSTLRYEILPKAKIVLCPSDGTSGGLGIDIHKLWPGKDSAGRQVVQVYAVDSYNSWVVIRTAGEFRNKMSATQSGMPLGLEAHRLLAQQWGVPFAVAEWAGNGDPKDEGKGDDIPLYHQLMNEWFRANAGDPRRPRPGQLLYEIYFNDLDQFRLLPQTVQPRSAQQYRDLVWGR